jgi:hypothetical protein
LLLLLLLLLSINNSPFSVATIESSLLALCTLLLELVLVNAGRWRGLFGAAAEARYDAGLKDRPAISIWRCAVAAKGTLSEKAMLRCVKGDEDLRAS